MPTYNITTGPLFTIEIDNGWYIQSLPMLTTWMVVEEPYITIYWADSQKGRTGVTRSTGALDYNDISFGYTAPSSASEVELEITNMIETAFGGGGGVQSVTDDGNGIIEVDNADPLNPVVTFTGKIPYVLGMSSGLIDGGEMTINANPALFDLAAGNGIIVDDYTDVNNPVVYEVSWSAASGITLTNIGSATYTHIFIDNSGSIVQTNADITGEERRDYIYLGHIGHTNLTSIGTIVNNPDNFTSPINQLRDLEEAVGTINLGVRVTANGANLNLDNTAGRIYLNGSYFHTNNKNPSFSPISSGTNISWRYRTQTGAGASASAIDPASWDNAGTITAIVGVKSTIQYIYAAVSGNFVIQYGQTLYNSLEEAEIAALAGSDPFITYGNIDEVFVLVGLLCIQSNATDLTDTNRALFINASKFGEVGVGGGGSSNTKTINGNSIFGTGNLVVRMQTITLQMLPNNWGSSTTKYFGIIPRNTSFTTANECRVYFYEAGTIQLVDILSNAQSVVGSNENISLYIRLNDTTDYLVATVGAATQLRRFTNTAMTIPIVNGDFIEGKIVLPAFGTPPTNVVTGGKLIFVAS